MKKLKKILPIILSLSMLLSLAACSGTESGAETESTEETEAVSRDTVSVSADTDYLETGYGTYIVFAAEESSTEEESAEEDDADAESTEETAGEDESEEETSSEEDTSEDSQDSGSKEGDAVTVTLLIENIQSWGIAQITDEVNNVKSSDYSTGESDASEDEEGEEETTLISIDISTDEDTEEPENWTADTDSVVFTYPGLYRIDIEAEDIYGGAHKISVSVLVTDTTCPVLTVPDSFEIEEGDDIDFMEGVSAEDEIDGDLTAEIVVDSEGADTSKAGEYTISYSVSDYSGNEARADVTLTVNEPEEETTTASSSSGSSSGSSSSSSSSSEDAQKEAQALAVAQEIAAYVLSAYPDGTDLEKVTLASQIVYSYTLNCTYTTEDSDYRTAYGVFIKGVYTCAGSTRALGLVLTCLGYSWTHVNENQWSHQWCVLTMDGQTGYADAMIGIAGYGSHPYVD